MLFWTLLLVTLSTTTTKILINHFSLSLLLTDGVSSFSSFRPLLHTPFRHKQASFPPPQSFPLITRIFFQYFSSKTQQQQTSNHTIHPNISWVCIFFPPNCIHSWGPWQCQPRMPRLQTRQIRHPQIMPPFVHPPSRPRLSIDIRRPHSQIYRPH